MRIALVSPYSSGPARGNVTTVRRIAAALTEAGCQVRVFAVDALTAPELEAAVRAFGPDLLQAFHAQHCGGCACRIARVLDRPVVVTLTGSDLFDPLLRRDPETVLALERASAVVCFDEYVRREALRHFPAAGCRLHVIPQGVVPPSEEPPPFPGFSEQDCLLLMPAALRPVKNIHFAVQALAPLARRMEHLRLVVAGGALDAPYGERLAGMAAAAPHLVLLGEVPHESMGGLYRRADLVVNCSLFEGGTPNSVLEAMVHGKGVLASDVPGNRALVREGVTGWLYRGEEEFRQKVARLAVDREERAAVGGRARALVLESFSPRAEAAAYCRLYQNLAGVSSPE